jgi:DNA-binding MarR family transcriptional regulator
MTGEIRKAVTLASGSSGALADAVVVIRDHPGVTAEWLGRALELSQPGTVHLVRRLSTEGLIEKRPGRNARSHALHLTSPGADVANRILRERGLPPDASELRIDVGLFASTAG